MPICARIFILRPPSWAQRPLVQAGPRGFVEPVDLRHLANDDELVAIGPDRAVVVEAVGLLGVAADHVGWLQNRARHRIVDAAAQAGHLGARHVHDLLLRMVHHAHALLDALGDDRARDKRAVGVERLDPVVVDDAGLRGVGLADPHAWPATRQSQHQQVVGVGGVDAPLLMRRDEIENHRVIAVRLSIDHRIDRFGVDRRAVDTEALAECPHPQVILVELLPAVSVRHGISS